MDLFLIILAFIFMVIGILGALLPVLPGPLTSWIGFLILYFVEGLTVSHIFLVVTFLIALTITVLDYIIPVAGTKRFGGSKAGMIGTSIGLVIGIIAPIPFGVILGPFIGALLGELTQKSDMNRALKSAVGSFIGFITSTFLKFIVALIYLGYFIIMVIDYKI